MSFSLALTVALIAGCVQQASLAQPCLQAAQLTLINIAQVEGCPLTLYFPADNSSKLAYLAPAFCVVQSADSVLRTALLKTDPLTSNSYINVPVIVSNSSLLHEAKLTLEPWLRDRKLEFLQVISAHQVDGLELPMSIVTEDEHVTALLSLRSSDFYSQLGEDGLLDLLHRTELKVTVILPGFGSLILERIRIAMMNQTRILTTLVSAAVQLPRSCTNLKHFKTIHVNDVCAVNILKHADVKGHYFIEPTLCYNGTTIMEKYDMNFTRLRLMLDIASRATRTAVRQRLLRERPLSTEYLPVIGAHVHLSNSIVKRGFKNLLLAENRIEVQILCDTTQKCEFLSSSGLWRHISFTAKSIINFNGKFCTWQSQKFGVSKPQKVSYAGKSLMTDYHPIPDGRLCINPDFIKQLSIQSIEFCASLCNNNARCQAFSKTTDLCKLYVFDKCSRNIMDCTCTQRGRVFVKKQPGLEPGGLCPAGYEGDRCGFKYKLYTNTKTWESGKVRCESEKGLVTMSDITEDAELSHIKSKWSNLVTPLWVGGYQQKGSVEPAGGWRWTGCETSIKRSLWHSGEPNNAYDNEDVAVIHFGSSKSLLFDFLNNGPHGSLCKCVSPFE